MDKSEISPLEMNSKEHVLSCYDMLASSAINRTDVSATESFEKMFNTSIQLSY